MRWIVYVLVATALAGCASERGDDPEPTTTDDPTATASGTTSSTTSSSSTTTSPAPKRGPVTWDIDIQGNDFVDGSISIQVGDSVRWTQRDSVPHTVTAEDGAFDSNSGATNRMVQGQTYTFEFTEVADYPYFCEVHPSMRDTITVLERHDATP